MLTPPHIIGFSLPTLVLIYTLAPGKVAGPRYYREAFGNESLAVEFRLPSNPHGWFGGDARNPRPFDAVVEVGDEVFEWKGVRSLIDGAPHYEIATGSGRFTASARSPKAGCPPELHYAWERPDGSPTQGTLPSGLCH